MNHNPDEAIANSPLAWIDLNEFVNENQQRLEFHSHRFMIDIYADESDDLVCKKSAQVGFSVMAILRSLWRLKYRKRNIIYALPTNNVVQDFVKPKVDPLILSNPTIASLVTNDSISLKKVGDRFIYFKGGFSEREAISITADDLVIDEYDRMPDPNVVNMFDSRLQAAANPHRSRFSNPSQIGYGVDMLYQDSNQFHWFVKCHRCNYEWYMEFSDDGKSHFISREQQQFLCGKCHQPLSDEDRRLGRWIAKYPSLNRHGYWISQLIAPWVSAKRILDQYDESNIQFFNNFVLGKAYTPSELVVNREAILRACAPSAITRSSVAIGVDQEAGGQIWAAMTPQGVFAHGKTSSWEEIEKLKLMWDATMVIDQMPYPTYPKRLADKYRDVYLCLFRDQPINNLKWDGKVVYADRTKVLDIVANEISDARLLFRENPYQLEDIIEDYQNIYRTTIEQDDGRIKVVWQKKANAKSDFPFALAYARIALTRILGGTSDFIEAEPVSDTPTTDFVNPQGRLESTLPSIVEETFAEMDE